VHLILIPTAPDKDGVVPLDRIWPMVVPLVQKAVDHSEGMTTLEEQYIALKAGQRQLWAVATNGSQIIAAAITTLQQFQTGLRVATIHLIGGDGLKDLLELRAEFESWAKTEGCNRVRFYARKGWARHLPDYKIAAYVMSKDL
jgi:hypothetical protein